MKVRQRNIKIHDLVPRYIPDVHCSAPHLVQPIMLSGCGKHREYLSLLSLSPGLTAFISSLD